MMAVIMYPSKFFEKDAEGLIGDQKEFCIVVPAASKKKEIVIEKLEKMFRGKHDGRSKLDRIIRTCRVLSFFSVLGAALHEDSYGIVYEDQGDLVILFRPKGPGGTTPTDGSLQRDLAP